MDKTVDARGLLCPEPVLLTKKAIEKEKGGTIRVLVDNNAARENVTRLAKSLGWNITITTREDEYEIVLTK